MRKAIPVSSLLLFLLVSSSLAADSATWTRSQNPGIGVVVAPDGTLYVGCIQNACKSTDHGNSWQELSGPGIGTAAQITSVLAVDSAGAIYASVWGGGGGNQTETLWVSRDGGATWATSRGPDFGTNFMSLTIDPFSGAFLLFEGFGFAGGSPPGYGGLSRSTDGGAHWSAMGQGMSGSVSAFVLDPRTPGRLYAATVQVLSIVPFVASAPALFTSSDGGSTWTPLASNLPGVFLTLVVDPVHASTIIGGGGSGIFRSTDGGRTFSLVNTTAVNQIVVDPVRSGRLYAATPANGVLTSADGGATWMSMNDGLTDLIVNEIALSPVDGFLYAATPSGEFVNRIAGLGTLTLDAAHPFFVTLSATDQRTGRTGTGVATKVNDLWGWFSIPSITGNPNNPEVFVKMLDGTAVNGAYWFFYGGLTDLEYTLTVTEVSTGRQRTYTKPAGSECGGSDTAAFGP